MNIVTVTMLKTEKGSPDGLRVQSYAKGKRYDIPESLATNFITSKTAKFETPEGEGK